MISDKDGEPDSPSGDTRLPSLPALRCFEAAARHQNFSRAADELHLTHGAISRAVRLLEDELGVALFERRSQRVFLTEDGRTLTQAVGKGLNLMQQAVDEVRARARQPRRWVLSCEPTLLMRWLIPRWPDFQARHPGVALHLVAGGGPFSFGSGIDLAIRRDDFDWPERYHATPLFAESVGPVCRPEKAKDWFQKKKSGTWLRPNAPRLHSRTRAGAWQDWAAAVGQPPPDAPGQHFDHFYFSLQAAVAGLGVAIGPWHLVRDDLDSGVLVAPLGFVEDGSRYCLLSPRPLAEDSLPLALTEWLRTVA